ncbi:KAP family P-loop NTPase fold protein [Pseudanabaena sp. Chao 1811]|uniref:KAP family P-loop NTPase fold protein n=1 Tax=Pseudanabaena sp. Chao 1811 TaxID=2963092 RepID=UPI0022F388B4|nr:P-loop NTPase fold protein [Pseudanabaena sp. Chao 1811]
MQIRHTKLEIPPDDPFKNDALGRKDLEPPLTQFITQSSGSFVLALDASWGSGKTTFLEMWQVKLQQEGHACLYLNAWQNDFAQEPLIAIIGELTKAIEDFADQSGETGIDLKKQMDKTRQFAQSLLKRLLPVGIKIATHGLLDIKEAAIEKAIADATSSGGEDLIKNYEKGKSEIKEFRKALGDLANQVASLNPSAKVVIIIDELDRCRPTYAIELLERVKHLFDASGVVFILGIDRSQLNHSIRSLYGSEFDATGYLKRFIDLDYRLPEPQAGDYCDYLFKYFGINELMKMKFNRNSGYELDQLKCSLGALMSAAKMSLRVQEQTISRLRIVIQTIPKHERVYGNVLSLLLFLREWNTNIYADTIEGKIDLDQIIPQIEALPRIKEVSRNFINIGMIEAYFLLILGELDMPHLVQPRLEAYRRLDKSVTTTEVEKAQQVLNTYGSWSNDNFVHHVGFRETVKRIAITNNFVSYKY